MHDPRFTPKMESGLSGTSPQACAGRAALLAARFAFFFALFFAFARFWVRCFAFAWHSGQRNMLGDVFVNAPPQAAH
jgi:hypothetical protein